MPKQLWFESEPYVEGWKVATDLDGNQLNRAVEKAGWSYFCLAGEVKTTVFGIDSQSMIRRAIERILARRKSDGFNSMEITQVASVGSERFPLVRYITLSAQWRHIQESLFLGCGTNLSKPANASKAIFKHGFTSISVPAEATSKMRWTGHLVPALVVPLFRPAPLPIVRGARALR